VVYITEPTWSNHELLFESLDFRVHKLPYYKNGAFDFSAYMKTLKLANTGSVIVLHTCAHNPTGCDPTRAQWKQIASVIRDRGLFPIFDSAYLGFNSGSVDEDAWAIRYFVEDFDLEVAVALSFAKNMGLYGERIGMVAFVTKTSQTAKKVSSILENVQRATVSSPVVYGAQIVSTILGDTQISKQWAMDLITMSTRIQTMRQRLYEQLVRLQTPGDWSHVTRQTGMFGYIGISSSQIQHLQSKFTT
jgi:aspartate aminotransferase, cytoplasmic